MMDSIQPLESPNRRVGHGDRRQCPDRRTHASPEIDARAERVLLRELLEEAHARIRMLEQAVERLIKAI